jgi:hypothetical protein
MRRLSFAILGLAHSMAMAAASLVRHGEVVATAQPAPRRERPSRLRAWWPSSNDRVRRHCDGRGESARRRRQINAGMLLTSRRAPERAA